MNKFETKQLKRLQRQKEQKRYDGYLTGFVVIIIAMRIVNEISSNISTYIQSAVVNEFFVSKGMTYEQGLASFTTMNMAVSAFTMLMVVYKPLADILGRKTILAINIAGVAIGMLVVFVSSGPAIYLFGVALYSFFTQNDVQMLYVLETAPKEKNASIFSIIKSIGILGLVFVPVLRDGVLGNDMSKWRYLYFWPVILCLIVFIMFVIFTKETDTFINARIATIKGDEENEKQQYKAGLKESIRYILSNKELKSGVLAYCFYGTCTMATYMYVESIMTTNGMSAQQITKAMYVYPFVYGGLYFLSGFVADKLGRKKVVVTSSLLVACGFCLFIYGCSVGINPYIIGLIQGVYLGSFWICGDYISVLFLENVPTHLRSSVLSGSSVLMVGGVALGLAIQMILLLNFGLNVATICLVGPCMLACGLTVLFKVKETRGTDLDEVKE